MTTEITQLDGNELQWETIKKAWKGGYQWELSPSAQKKVAKCRDYVDQKSLSDRAYYGINTGFGMMAQTRIAEDQLAKLQENLILSHCAGVGEPLPIAVVRLMVLYRVHVLAMGHSGVKVETIEKLLALLNHEIIPVIPSQGSVGASGDLAPLAHLAAACMGLGECFFEGGRISAQQALKKCGLEPLVLASKEGLSLINGTQGMCALLSNALIMAEQLIQLANGAAALTIEGLFGSLRPFDSRISSKRQHPGHKAVSQQIQALLSKSQIMTSHENCGRVQDPYSLRCVPQVHGAVYDAIVHTKECLLREINSCCDNPLIFPDEDLILSGGNFHGVAIGYVADLMAIALTDLGSISERRIEQLTNPKAGELRVRFLVPNPGLNSGMMMPHVTASALVSENKTLSHPASVDSIPTSAGQEDHVSMGMWATRKLQSIIKNLEYILAIEFLCGAQAIDLHPDYLALGEGTMPIYQKIREKIPFISEDRYLAKEIEILHDMLYDLADSCGLQKEALHE